MPTTDQLSTELDRLARLEPTPFPVVSLYLDLQPDQHGRDNFTPFVRKELAERLNTYPAGGPERQSLERDADRIRQYLEDIDPAANGLALFACSGIDLFEASLLGASPGTHRLSVSSQPHLYPLARLIDEQPRYAVLLADTNASRIFVVAAGEIARSDQVAGVQTKRHKAGGWSQARYQRHVENYHVHHAKEVVETLARIVREEQIPSVLVAGDEVIVPLLKEQFPKDLAEKVVDFVKLDARTPEHAIVDATRSAIRDRDQTSDAEAVEALLDAFRANGLGTIGVDRTKHALELGQADELVIAARPDLIAIVGAKTAETAVGELTPQERVADELVAKAHQTGAGTRFIQDASLAERFGGAGAFLRFKL